MPSPEVRNARTEDAAAMARVETASWPAELAADVAQIVRRIETFAPGQRVADAQGEIVGTVYAQRISHEFFHAGPLQYDRLTDGGTLVASHDPHGEIYHLIGVGVLPSFAGTGLGRELVNSQLATARSMIGIERILGFTRPVGFHRYPQMAIEDYVQLRGPDGRLIDPVLAFHTENGARIVSLHADYRPDAQTRNYGVLIGYPAEREPPEPAALGD